MLWLFFLELLDDFDEESQQRHKAYVDDVDRKLCIVPTHAPSTKDLNWMFGTASFCLPDEIILPSFTFSVRLFPNGFLVIGSPYQYSLK